jgi:hypothetical protein
MNTRFPTLSMTRSCRLRAMPVFWAALEKMVFHRHPDREFGTYFRFGYRRTSWGLALSAVDLFPPRPGELSRKSPIVSFSPEYISRAVDERDQTRLGIGFVHSHPLGVGVYPSGSDNDMDQYFARLATPYGSDQPYVSLIVNRDRRGRLVFSGRVHDRGEWMPVTDLHIVGTSLQRFRSDLVPRAKPPGVVSAAILERWAKLVGPQQVETLVGGVGGILGCSGTGSPAIEALARSQLGGFVPVDPQALSLSNLERVHGTTLAQCAAEQPPLKVRTSAELIRSINPGAQIFPLVGNALDDLVLDYFLLCDFVLGCTDTLHGRAFLGDLAALYLVPSIDVGVLPRGKDGRMTSQLIDLTRYAPGEACPFCLGRIDARQLHAELLPPEERERCKAEATKAMARGEDGTAYWQGDPPQLPAVGYLTTTAGAMAAGYALNWLLGTSTMPHQRMQFDLGLPNFAFVGDNGVPDAACNCVRCLGHGDQGERSVTRPAHLPRAWRMREKMNRSAA